MEDVGIIDYLGLATNVHAFLNEITPEYDHILVDESQDFGTTELTILQRLAKPGENNFFLCGDVAQSVLPKHRSLPQAGIVLTGGRERILKKLQKYETNSRGSVQCITQ